MEASTLAIVSLVGGAIGTGIQALGAYQSAQATAAADRYQAQVAKNNAQIAEQNAAYATQAGQAQAEDAGLRARSALGAVKAAEAAGGIDVNSGSATDAQTTEREVGLLNTNRIVNNAALQAYGYRTQETNFLAQQQLLQGEAQQAASSALPSAFGTLLSGASSLGTNWLKFGQTGVLGGSSSGGGGAVDSGLFNF